jgi:single-strand DNA-binding protein
MSFIHIAGHLGADPEVRFTSTGKKVTTFRVACRTRKGQNEDTIWYRVTVWGEQYDKLISYLKKGSAVMVAGELQKPELFNDREGKPQIALEITASFIQFSPFGGKSTGSGGTTQQQQEHAAPAAAFGGFSQDFSSNPPVGSPSPMGQTFDDEVPF